jgi:hypothetical protein
MWKTRTGGALAMTLALAACDTPIDPGSDDVIDADVAIVAGSSAIDAVSFITSGQGMGSDAVPHSRNRTVTFLDADGNPQDRYDPLTTASIRTVHEIAAEVSRDGWSGSLHRTSDIAVSGLAGHETTRLWNGAGTESVERSAHSDERGSREYDLNGSWSLNNVVTPVGDSPWPLSGNFTHDITVTVTRGDQTHTRERHVTITFNGTSTVPMIVNGETFELDLATRPGRVPVFRFRERDRR